MSKILNAISTGEAYEVLAQVNGTVRNVIVHKNRYYTWSPLAGRYFPQKKSSVRVLDVMSTQGVH